MKLSVTLMEFKKDLVYMSYGIYVLKIVGLIHGKQIGII